MELPIGLFNGPALRGALSPLAETRPASGAVKRAKSKIRTTCPLAELHPPPFRDT